MADIHFSIWTELGKKTIRFAVTIVGLLILRAVLGALPMLRNASAIDGTFLSPLVVANTVVDTLILLAILTFGIAVSRVLRTAYPHMPDLSTFAFLVTTLLILVLAYNLYEMPTACVVISPQSAFSRQAAGIPPQVAEMWRQVANAASAEVLKLTTGTTLEAYQKVAVVNLRQPPDYYGWIFLILCAIPVVGMVVIGTRNLDPISEFLFHKARAATTASQQNSLPGALGAIRCNNCGEAMSAGVKFCSNCGAATSAAPQAPSARRCSSCGTENIATARFCKECGRAL